MSGTQVADGLRNRKGTMFRKSKILVGTWVLMG